MKYHLTFLFAALLGVCTAGASDFDKQFQKPPAATVVPSAANKMDGVVSDEEAGNACGLYGLCVSENGRILPAEVKVYVSTDGTKLYFSSVCETGEDGVLQRANPVRGKELTGMDDVMEYTIVPEPNSKDGIRYTIMVNNKGAYLASAVKNGKTIPWKLYPEFAGSVKDNEWTLETALLLDDLGIKKLKSGQEIGLQVRRIWRRMKGEFGQTVAGTWSIDPKALPTVTFRKSAPVIRFLSVAKDEKPALKVSLYNPGDKDMTFVTHFVHLPDCSQSADRKSPVTLKAKETVIMDLPIQQVTAEETVRTLFEVLDKSEKKVIYRRAFRWGITKPDLFKSLMDKSDLLAVKYAFYPSVNCMYLQINTSGIPDGALKKLIAEVKDSSGKSLAVHTMPPPVKGISAYYWQLPDLKAITKNSNPSGEYTLEILPEGVSKNPLIRKFQRKVFQWEDNTIGMSDKIIPGFTPIKVSMFGNTVSTVLREHKMNKLGLFEQIRADGEDLLKEDGIRFEAVIDGKPVSVKGKSLDFTQKSDTKATAKAAWSAGNMNADALCEWDYDGVMKYTLTLNPFAGTLDSLKMVVPLDSAHAYLIHPVTDGLRNNYAGKTPEKWSSKDAHHTGFPTDFVHYIWIGTETRGFSVFGENDKGWSNAKGVPAQELYHKDGVTYLVYNLVSKPLKIQQPRTIVMGFQATPVKPMPDRWRKQFSGWIPRGEVPKLVDYSMTFLGSGMCQGGFENGIFPREEDLSIWHEYRKIRETKTIPPKLVDNWIDNLPSYCNSEKMKATLRAEIGYGVNCMKGAGTKKVVTFYTNGRGMRLDTPEALTFMDDWFIEEFQPQRDKAPNPLQSKSYSLEPMKSYQDFAAYWYQKMLSIGVTDNLYWDDMYLSCNMDHTGRDGAYIMEDGRMQPSVGLWSLRELIRRAAVVQLELGLTPRNMVHMTNAAIAPVLSFAQQNLDWEDHYGTNYYQERYTRDYIRTETTGLQFGNLPAVLGLTMMNSARDKKENIAPAIRSGTGVILTHELPWMQWQNNPDYWKILADFYKFGYGEPEAKVWNYWDKDYPVSISGETSSIILGKANEAYILISSWEPKNAAFTITLNPEKLGLSGTITAVNGETNAPVEIKDNAITVDIPKYDFIYLKVKGN